MGVTDTACQFVIPASALNEVSKICGDTDETIEIVQGTRHIMFRIDQTTLITRRLEGEFLNYSQAIPADNPISVTVDRRQLISSIERCSLIITEQQKSPLRCTFGDGVLTLRTATAIGNAHDQCPIQGNGGELEIGFNNRYLLDALRNARTEQVKMEISGPLSPVKVLPAEGNDFLYLVLPVRFKND